MPLGPLPLRGCLLLCSASPSQKERCRLGWLYILFSAATKPGHLTPFSALDYNTVFWRITNSCRSLFWQSSTLMPPTSTAQWRSHLTLAPCVVYTLYLMLILGSLTSCQHLGLGGNCLPLLLFQLNEGLGLKNSGKIMSILYINFFGWYKEYTSPVSLFLKDRNTNKGIIGWHWRLGIFLQTATAAAVSSQDSCSLWLLWLKFSEKTVSYKAPQ